MHKATTLRLLRQSYQWRSLSMSTRRPVTKNIFVPSPTKTAEFKMKNRHESAEITKPKHVLCVFSVIF